MLTIIKVYFTLLASTPSISPRKKDSIQKSISQIIQLHEELLVELHQVVPPGTDRLDTLSPLRHARNSKHTRWYSADNGRAGPWLGGHPRRRMQRSADMTRSVSPISRSMIMTTNTVLQVAKIFDRFVSQLYAMQEPSLISGR